MYGTRSVCADGWEEVLRLETVCYVVESLAVTGKEDGACSRTITDADNVALNILRPVYRRIEGLVKSSSTCGRVGNGILVVS